MLCASSATPRSPKKSPRTPFSPSTAPAPNPQKAITSAFWLRKAATHAAIGALRRRAHQPESAGEEWLDHDHQHGHAEFQQHPGLEARLDTLLRTLPDTLRVPIVLRYTEDLDPQEIATILDQPLATVKSNLQRGLGLLRRKAAVTLKDFVRQGVPS